MLEQFPRGSHFRFDFFGYSKCLFVLCCLHATNAVMTWLSADSEASVDASGFGLCVCLHVISSTSSHHHPDMLLAVCVSLEGDAKHGIRTRPWVLWSWAWTEAAFLLFFPSCFSSIYLLLFFLFAFKDNNVFFVKYLVTSLRISLHFSLEIPFILILYWLYGPIQY